MDMYTENNFNTQENLFLFLGVLVLIIFSGFIYWLKKVEPFLRERRYIKAEIRRSFDEEERLEWEKDLKKLYLTSIPLIGKLFR